MSPPEADDTDAALLERWRRNQDQDAFASLARRHTPIVRAVCRRHLGDPLRADECTQAVLIQLARSATQIRDPTRLAGWLHRTALRACAMQARKAASRRRELPMNDLDVPAPSSVVPDTAEIRSLLDQAIDRLSRGAREAVIIHFLEGHDRAETANRLDITEEALKKRLAYGLESIRSFLSHRGVTISCVGIAALLTEDCRCYAALSPLPEATPAARSLADGLAAASGPLTSGALLAGLGAVLAVVLAGAFVLTRAAPVPPLDTSVLARQVEVRLDPDPGSLTPTPFVLALADPPLAPPVILLSWDSALDMHPVPIPVRRSGRLDQVLDGVLADIGWHGGWFLACPDLVVVHGRSGPDLHANPAMPVDIEHAGPLVSWLVLLHHRYGLRFTVDDSAQTLLQGQIQHVDHHGRLDALLDVLAQGDAPLRSWTIDDRGSIRWNSATPATGP